MSSKTIRTPEQKDYIFKSLVKQSKLTSPEIAEVLQVSVYTVHSWRKNIKHVSHRVIKDHLLERFEDYVRQLKCNDGESTR